MHRSRLFRTTLLVPAALLFSTLAAAVTPIASIQDSIDVYDGRTVTIEAIALGDNGDLWPGHTSVYVQDASGKGIQLFDYNTVYTMARGDKVRITGEIEDYQGNNDFATTEIKPHSAPSVLSSGEPMPTPTDLTTAAANTPEWEGAYVRVTGEVTDYAQGIGGGTNIGVDDGSGEFTVRVWDSIGINLVGVDTGDSIVVTGVVSPYANAHQLLLVDEADYRVGGEWGGGGGGGGGGVDPGDIIPIKTVQDSIHIYDGQIITIEGVVTIGYGKIREDYTSIYVQDESGRGMNIFDFDAHADLVRGTRVRIQGQVEDYISGEAVYGTTELTNLAGIEVLEVGVALPEAAVLSIGESNDPTWDGTLIALNGWVTETPSEAGGGWNVELYDGSGTSTARVWETTGLSDFVAANIHKDALIQVTGIGSVYNDAFQALVCYEEDFVLQGTPPDDFEENEVNAATVSIPRPLFAPTLGESVRILWNAPAGSRVWVQVFDIEGRAVATLLETTNSPPYGDRAIYWDGRDRLRQRLPAGTYLLSVRAAADGTFTHATAPIVIGARLQ